MLANLLAITDSAGIATTIQLGFVDEAISALLGIDGHTEFPLAVISLGAAVELPVAAEPVDPLAVDVPPLSRRPVDFPFVAQSQRAGNLHTANEVLDFRQRSTRAAVSRPVVADIGALSGDETVESLILRRGSTRVFRHEQVPRSLLDLGLVAAMRPVPVDTWGLGSTSLSVAVSVHAVAGLAPGRYRWGAGELVPHALTDELTARTDATRLCLNQPLGGDSAFTVFFNTDLRGVLTVIGSRAYRAAQLEAGLAAGRLQLMAFALGFGGTGLTFFDDLLHAAFGTPDELRTHLAAIPGPTEVVWIEGGDHGLRGKDAEVAAAARTWLLNQL